MAGSPILAQSAAFLLTVSLAESSWASYQTAANAWKAYSEYRKFSNTAPFVEVELIGFVSFLFSIRKISYSATKNYLAGVKSLAITVLGADVSAFKSKRLKRVLKGFRKVCPEKKRKRLPITIWLLRKLVNFWDKRGMPGDDVLATASVTAFMGLMRAAELSSKLPMSRGLRRDQIKMEAAKATIDLKVSKTDIFRDGVQIKLFATENDLCPIARLKALQVKFPSSEYVFPMPNGKELSYQAFQTGLREALTGIGLVSAEYGTHSFRIGAASTLAIMGVESHIIKVLGRWKSLTYQYYVQLSDEALRRAQLNLGNAKPLAMIVPGASRGVEAISQPVDGFETVEQMMVLFNQRLGR